MDFDKPKVYGDTFITDGLVFLAKDYFCKLSTHEVFVFLPSLVILSDFRLNKKDVTFTSVVEDI